jgi:lipoate-protein ligase A
MHAQWRFINTGSHDAAYNMALDEAMLLLHEAGETLPALRVYGWDTPTLSLGYAQHAAREVDFEACEQDDVAVVRRPTGGRAVLHHLEVTYSVVLPTSLHQGADTLTEHYRLIGVALEAALHALGLPVRLERTRLRGHPRRAATSPACFAALARYELSAGGKKIVGSAQKRLRRSLLQHGSIPLWLDRQRLFGYLRVPAERRPALIREAYTTMTAVNEIAPATVSPAALHEALRAGFATSFGAALLDASPLPEELRLAQQLRATKYATAAWNLDGPAAWRLTPAAMPDAHRSPTPQPPQSS